MFEQDDIKALRVRARWWRALVVAGAFFLGVCVLVVRSEWNDYKRRRIEACHATTFDELEEALGAPDARYGDWNTECWRYQWSGGCRVWCSTDWKHVEEHQGFLLCNMVE